MSYSTGRFTFGVGYGGRGGYRGGWWGPVGYRPYYRGYNRGWHHGYRAGYAAGRRAEHYSNNLYARPTNRDRNAIQPRARTTQVGLVSGHDNNVFSDRNGNIHRRQGDGSWESRRNGQWTKSDLQGAAADRKAPGGASTRDRSATREGGAARPHPRTLPGLSNRYSRTIRGDLPCVAGSRIRVGQFISKSSFSSRSIH